MRKKSHLLFITAFLLAFGSTLAARFASDGDEVYVLSIAGCTPVEDLQGCSTQYMIPCTIMDVESDFFGETIRKTFIFNPNACGPVLKKSE